MVLPVACSPGPADSVSLEGTQWVLVRLEGESPLPGTVPSAEFSAEEISGTAGCNHYFGAYTASGSDITIGDLAQTEMSCADREGLMDQKQVKHDVQQTQPQAESGSSRHLSDQDPGPVG
jgi:heat shock protein HslJ